MARRIRGRSHSAVLGNLVPVQKEFAAESALPVASHMTHRTPQAQGTNCATVLRTAEVQNATKCYAVTSDAGDAGGAGLRYGERRKDGESKTC